MDMNREEALPPNLYYDRNIGVNAVKILPGEYYVTARDMVLVTVLGSCVAACIRDRMSGIGGMNHFMLPGGKRDDGGLAGSSARYGAYAMELMINQLLKMGAWRSNLEAKVFGGGEVLHGCATADVGVRNAEFVLDYLHTESIAVTAQDMLGIYPRKIYFFPHTGRVRVKKLCSMHNNTIIEREQEYRSRLMGADVRGEVELF